MQTFILISCDSDQEQTFLDKVDATSQDDARAHVAALRPECQLFDAVEIDAFRDWTSKILDGPAQTAERLIVRFEIGKTYFTRSLGDSNCIIRVTIASRTEKFVTSTEGERFGILQDYLKIDGVEAIRPWGRYSLSPILRATREWTEAPVGLSSIG